MENGIRLQNYLEPRHNISKGVAIAFKRNLKIFVVSILPDKDGRYLFDELTLKQKMFCLAIVYCLNNDNPMYFQMFSMTLTTFHPLSSDFK